MQAAVVSGACRGSTAIRDGNLSRPYSLAVSLGMLRAQQGVPFSNLYWAICIAHEHLWAYIQQECLLDEPVEFWGGVNLLRSLTQFFNRALYFALLGYEKVADGDLTASAARIAQR